MVSESGMRKSQNVMLFVVFFGFALWLVQYMGIGGIKINNMQFWNSVTGQALVLITTVECVIIIMAGFLASGMKVEVFGFGVQGGGKLHISAAWIGFSIIYLAVCGWCTGVFYQMPYIGDAVGPLFGVICFFLYIFDLFSSTVEAG